MADVKLGRLPRAFDLRIPDFSRMRLVSGSALPSVPSDFDHAAPLPVDVGMMLNNMYGCCVIADAYHGIQLFSKASRNVEITEPDNFVEQAYRENTNPPFDPRDPTTDTGLVMQNFMKWEMNVGLPIPVIAGTTRSRHKTLGFVEVDVRNQEDLAVVSYEFGKASIGFNVPQYLMDNGTGYKRWDLDPTGNQTIAGGHCVGVTGARMTPSGLIWKVTSWALRDYEMTEAFRRKYMDEGYGKIDPSWMQVPSGKTPLGMSQSELVALMPALRG